MIEALYLNLWMTMINSFSPPESHFTIRVFCFKCRVYKIGYINGGSGTEGVAKKDTCIEKVKVVV